VFESRRPDQQNQRLTNRDIGRQGYQGNYRGNVRQDVCGADELRLRKADAGARPLGALAGAAPLPNRVEHALDHLRVVNDDDFDQDLREHWTEVRSAGEAGST
jgi:hypothetical protein